MRRGRCVIACFVACAAVLVLATAAFVQESSAPSKGDPLPLCEQALDRLMLGEADGIDSLLQDAQQQNVNWQRFRTDVGLLKEQVPKWGKPLGYELLEEKQYGTTFSRCKYVVKYQRQYVIWTFLLVRLDGPWMIQNVNFSTDIQALFV